MQSRMDKYQPADKKKYERLKKNTQLYEKVYDDIYSDTTYKNMQVIDSAKEININKLKNILDDKYDTRQYRTLKNYSIDDVVLDDTDILNKRRQRSYDINKIIDDAKNKRAFIEEAKEKQKYFDFSESRNKKYDDRYDELEKEEQELEELINTMVISKGEEDDELFSDLMGAEDTIVTNPVKTNFDSVDVNSLTNTSLVENSKTGKVDKAFYTDSNMFTKNDFEDFSTISKELNKSRRPLKIILIIILLLILSLVSYFVVTTFIAK